MTSSSEPPLLTVEGRKGLEERARRLEEETIPTVLAAIEEAEDELSLQLEYDLASRELEQLRYVLDTARSIHEVPEEPGIAQIGDWVTLQTGDDESVTHLIVHPAEAVLDVSRISADSPLARAVLGLKVGDEAVVQAPSGPYTAKVVEVKRDDS